MLETSETLTADLIYFAPLLPWQNTLWQKLTSKALSNQNTLPHAMLASGNSGIGKRAFVWRWVAWQLCHNRHNSLQVACGYCESCRWLQAGTNPDLQVLPAESLPTESINQYSENSNKSKKNSKSDKNISNKTISNKTKPPRIKIDDIRGIQSFVQHGSSDMRICVFDFADTMTIASANALLKTLEEPRTGVQLILITDKPALLLPTIKSRVQQLPLTKIEYSVAHSYVTEKLINENLVSDNLNGKHLKKINKSQVTQLLLLSSNSPLQAIKIAQSRWYPLRQLWLKTWLALKSKTRTAITASDYWQSQLQLGEFITLTHVMMVELLRLSNNLPTYQQDVDFNAINNQTMPKIQSLQKLQLTLQSIELSLKQNVQDKLAYDMLMQELSYL